MGRRVAGGLALGVLAATALYAGPQPVSAAVSPTIVLVSSNAWIDTAGNAHVDGEVQNAGPGVATNISITVNYYDSSGNLLKTDQATTQQASLLPGDDSGFEDIFVNTPTNYAYDRITSLTASNGGPPANIDFTTSVTGQATDGQGNLVLSGSITNDSTTSAQNVFVYFTFFNSGLQTVYAEPCPINIGNQNDLNAGQTTNFQCTVPNTQGIPAYSSFSYVAASQTSSSSGIAVDRLFGTDGIATAISVSEHQFPAMGSAKAVVLARSDFFSDALCGGPLAAQLGGPLLVTPGTSASATLDPRVRAEIQRVLPPGGTVYIVGGTLALSPDIDTALQSIGYSTQRIAGPDEFATCVGIAQQMGNPSTVFEATGTSFADALSAVPPAIALHGAILLTNGNQQSPETAAYLAQHPPTTRYAIGGPQAAAGADPSATAIFGPDLYGTSAAVASRFFPTVRTFGVATGVSYNDALSGGVFMGGLAPAGGPILLVAPTAPLPASVAGYLKGDAANLTEGIVFGGSLALGSDVQSALEATG